MVNNLIERQAAIDIERNATVDTNPSHFEAHQKFTQFMDDAEISSFGRWQWSNGFNTALTAVGADLKRLPSAQTERCEDCENFRKTRLLIPQPEKRTEECTETHACDLISRQAAIDAIEFGITYAKAINKETGEVKELFQTSNDELRKAADRIKQLPSAQPYRKAGRWIPCKPTQDYIINNKKLWDKEQTILITYKTRTGKRYVRAVLSERGHIPKKINGEIIAWQFLPEPYKEGDG